MRSKLLVTNWTNLCKKSSSSTECWRPTTPVPTLLQGATRWTRYFCHELGVGGWPLRLSFAIPRFHGQIGGVSWVEGQGGGRCGKMVPYDQQQFGRERYKNQNLCKDGTNIDTKDRQEYFVWWIIGTNHIPTNFYHIKVTYIIVLSTCICCRWNFLLLFRIGNRRWREDRLRKNCCFLCRFSGGNWCLGGIGIFFWLT